MKRNRETRKKIHLQVIYLRRNSIVVHSIFFRPIRTLKLKNLPYKLLTNNEINFLWVFREKLTGRQHNCDFVVYCCACLHSNITVPQTTTTLKLVAHAHTIHSHTKGREAGWGSLTFFLSKRPQSIHLKDKNSLSLNFFLLVFRCISGYILSKKKSSLHSRVHLNS